jgi:histidinol dehydrogenase
VGTPGQLSGKGMPLLPWRTPQELLAARRRVSLPDPQVRETVATILREVALQGDEAVARWTERLDGVRLAPHQWTYGPQALKEAYDRLAQTLREDLAYAARRIEAYQRRLLDGDAPRLGRDEEGFLLGEVERPVDRAGIYVPAGSAPLFSTVLMAALVARVAGVEDITVCTPPAGGGVHPAILGAAHLAGVSRVVAVGGAQAIGALALGTATILPVDVVAGPGNRYVTEAKRQVYGLVGVDGLMGPSEVLVLADGTEPPRVAAADLLAQAEHDAYAWPVLVATDREWAEEVRQEVARQLATLPRAEVARAALQGGACCYVPTLEEGARWAGGAARFSRPLSVKTFRRRMSVLGAPAHGAAQALAVSARLAREEGLEGHARAAQARIGP